MGQKAPEEVMATRLRAVYRYLYQNEPPQSDIELIESVEGVKVLEKSSQTLLVEYDGVWTALYMLDLINNLPGWWITSEAVEATDNVSECPAK